MLISILAWRALGGSKLDPCAAGYPAKTEAQADFSGRKIWTIATPKVAKTGNYILSRVVRRC